MAFKPVLARASCVSSTGVGEIGEKLQSMHNFWLQISVFNLTCNSNI